MDPGPGANDLREHRPRATADVEHSPHRLPATGELKLRVGNAVSCRSDEGVEARRDLRMGVQVLPERQAENLVVGGSACPDVGEEAAPCVGKTAADAFEVKAQTLRWVEEPPGGFVQRESAGLRFLKDAFAHQMFEHPVQDIGVALRRRRKVIDFVRAGGDMVGDSQGCHYVDAPRRAKIAQRSEIRNVLP